MAVVSIIKYVDPTPVEAVFADFVMGITDQWVAGLPMIFRFGGQRLRFAGDAEDLAPGSTNFCQNAALNVAS